MNSKLVMTGCMIAAGVLQGCAAPMQQPVQATHSAPADIRDQWDIRISKAELVFPGAQPHDVANGVKDALSQFAIPANLSFRAMPSTPPLRPGVPELKQVAAAVPSPEYTCDGAYAEIAKRPPPVQNAFAFISEGHQVCLYSFAGGVKSYVIYYNIKKMESLTAGLFNGITRAIRGSDEERAKGELTKNIESIRSKFPNLLVERIEIPGMPVETPDLQAVAALIPPLEAVEPSVTGTHSQGAVGARVTSLDRQVEARKNLTAMGITYHSQKDFLAAIERNDEVAVRLFIEGGGVNLTQTDGKGKTPLQVAQAKSTPDIVALLQSTPQVEPSQKAAQPAVRDVAVMQEVDFSQVPAETLAEIDAQIATMNLTPEQRLIIRSNLARQYLQVQSVAAGLPRN